ncbi:MAG: hypothetical protein WD750_04180 [Gammaproteobacteria bacterium]
MSIIEIVVHPQMLTAAMIYAGLSLIGIVFFHRIHALLENSILFWKWEHIGMPLLRTALMLAFILIAYPILFGLTDAPPLIELFARDGMRLNYLFNLIFIVTLILPLTPVIGEWTELVLPLQGIAASLLLFSWLADAAGVEPVRYWPGWNTVFMVLILAMITHWLATALAKSLGGWLDRCFNVTHAGELVSRSLVLFLQYPVIVVFCQGLGKQLN